MKYLGVDYGEKRVGIALSDDLGKLAFPHSVLLNDKDLLKSLKDICNQEGVNALVIGESKDFHGKANPIMEKAQEFANLLHAEIGLPIFWEPEFMTSLEAERIQGKNEMHDASAAALILGSYLQKQNTTNI